VKNLDVSLHRLTAPFPKMPLAKKGTLIAQSACSEKGKLLCAQNRVFARFGNAKFDHALGRNLNLFTGGGITADASGSIYQDQFPQTRNRELVLGLLVRQLSDAFEDLSGLFFGEPVLFGDRRSDL
jgi:hypothetical protein